MGLPSAKLPVESRRSASKLNAATGSGAPEERTRTLKSCVRVSPLSVTRAVNVRSISEALAGGCVTTARPGFTKRVDGSDERSEEHTSELQSRGHLVCRLLLEKKKQ